MELEKRKLADIDTSSDDDSECHTELKKRKVTDTSSDDDSECHTELKKGKVTDDVGMAENKNCSVARIEKSAVDEDSSLVGTQNSDCSGTGSSEVQQKVSPKYCQIHD